MPISITAAGQTWIKLLMIDGCSNVPHFSYESAADPLGAAPARLDEQWM